MGQSSNDVIPAAIRIAALTGWRRRLMPALEELEEELSSLAGAHAATVTLGRTHLMDAVPTTYGRIFAGWAVRLRRAARRCERIASDLRMLPLGGTAVGTGIGSAPGIAAAVTGDLCRQTGLDLEAEATPAAGIAAQNAPIAYAGALAGIARILLSISNDLRLRSSGPFGGIGELRLPAVQPGSSIMPGKVNPVIPEAVAQVSIWKRRMRCANTGPVATRPVLKKPSITTRSARRSAKSIIRDREVVMRAFFCGFVACLVSAGGTAGILHTTKGAVVFSVRVQNAATPVPALAVHTTGFDPAKLSEADQQR